MKKLDLSFRRCIDIVIRDRRSIRRFTSRKVSHSRIKRIVAAGHYAPSGLNNQPWRFVIVLDQGVKQEISTLTHYSRIIKNAAALIIVFLDSRASYSRQKDHQAIGACIQNMLLAAHSYGIGSCWLGEILKNSRQIQKVCAVKKEYEVQAVIALGYPAEKPRLRRKPLDKLILKTII